MRWSGSWTRGGRETFSKLAAAELLSPLLFRVDKFGFTEYLIKWKNYEDPEEWLYILQLKISHIFS